MPDLPTEPAPPAPETASAGDAILTGGQTLVRALSGHGVTQVFGIPGTHNLEIYRHLAPYGIRHVTPRHEQGAGYAADGYARVTGRPGIVLTTTGPALLNAAAAVGQAYSDSVPMLVVSPGMPLRHPRLSTGLLHETRGQTEALRGVAAFSHRASSVAEIETAVARAFTLFRTGRPRPVHIEIPLDLLEASEVLGPVRLAPPLPRATPDPLALRQATRALAGARHPALILGGGARHATRACLALAERLAAPVVTTANGKGIVPETHPLSLGVALHSPGVRKWLTARDVVIAVGTELAESDFWSPPPALDGTLVRIDIDADQMYGGTPADVALVGDARTTVQALLTEIPAAGEQHHARVPAEAEVGALRTARDAGTAARDARWIPYLKAIRSVLADDAIITSDSAQCCYYGALPHLPLSPRGRYLHPTGFGTLGYALPAAIGAKTAHPARQVLALGGDGGLQFTVQELATAVQLRLPLPIVVFDNGGYGEIRAEMASRGDTPTAVDLPPVDLPALARAYGGHGTRACTAGELRSAVTEALDAPGPTLITVPEESS